MPGERTSSLTEFQIEVAQVFFDLPSSDGFLLAGGAALAAQRLTLRPTQDLDFFTSPGAGNVRRARDAFVAAVESRGWTVEHLRDTDTFCRLLIRGPEDLLVDLALDSPPGRPATASIAGPTFALDELAGRKVIALFDRAAARDFVDVFALTSTFTRGRCPAGGAQSMTSSRPAGSAAPSSSASSRCRRHAGTRRVRHSRRGSSSRPGRWA